MKATEIINICKEFNITNYVINADKSLDVNENVNFNGRNLEELPLKFNRVVGDFDISFNQLQSLTGVPITVDGDFNISHNLIESLKYGPESVSGSYDCSFNKLGDLTGAPIIIHKDFICHHNKLTWLYGAPDEVVGDFDAHSNDLLTLLGSPTIVRGDFYVPRNFSLINLIGCPFGIGGDFTFDDTLLSLFADNEPCFVDGDVKIMKLEDFKGKKLPTEILDNEVYLKYVLEKQSLSGIWNSDMNLNQSNFEIMIDKIKSEIV